MTTDERIHILIIEDEGILAMAMSDNLEAEGYYVAGIAGNGRKALDLFQHNRVDLVLCDITIRGDWDGIETVRHLIAERPVPVVYLTALSDRDTLTRAMQTYPAAYLNKPYQVAGLRTAIEVAIQNFGLRVAGSPVPAVDGSASPKRDALSRESLLQVGEHLFIKQNYQFVKISLADLLYLEADDAYTALLTTGRKYLLRLTLSNILERIEQPGLVRIHRSYAVNIHKVDAFNDAEVSIGPQLLPLSRNFRDDFLRQFQFR